MPPPLPMPGSLAPAGGAEGMRRRGASSTGGEDPTAAAAAVAWAGPADEARRFRPPAWMLAEILQRIIPPRVSWTQLGMPLGDYEAMAQAASLLGPEFLSFLAAGGAVFVAVICRRTGTTGRLAGVVIGPGLMVLVMLWGQLHINAARMRASREIRS